MIQSDTLSRQPDLCPDDDNYEDIVMLPQDMFLYLIDMELQNGIALSDDLDGIAAESLKLLLEMAPTSMTTGLNVVFESPVRFGLLPIFGKTETKTGPHLSQTGKRPNWTAKDWSFAVFYRLFQSLDRSWS